MSFVPYRRGGMGDGSINPTTIWTPSAGFFSTPGQISTSQAAVTQAQYQAAGTPTYVAPTLVPVPACAFGPAATADSAACQQQVMAAQQQNMQLSQGANNQAFLYNCVQTVAANPAGPGIPTQANCQTMYGGTQAFGANGGVNAPNIWPTNPDGTPAGTGPVVKTTPPPPPVVATPPPATPPPAGNYVAPTTSFFDNSVPVDGFNVPVWGLLAAAAGLLFVMGGKH